jgi:hypothetical protein
LAQTIASNLEAVIEPAAVRAVAVVPVVRAELAELAAQGVREALVAPAVQGVPAVQVDPVVQAVPVVPAVPVLAIVQAEAQALVIVQAVEAQAQLIVQAEAGLELVPVAEPAVNPVEAQVLVQVAARARIKSATAARHHGQVRVPKRAEDLAAVAAATMHAPAVTEVATAWAVAE